MITKKDLEIQNTSYTNKDFSQIYPEQLDIIKKITNKWDPETTNESDPGIVLTKLNAFIGDKLNYNVDKNILERFAPSATQETSMNKIAELIGYNRNYYISATSKISFRYTGTWPQINENSDVSIIRIKSFDTELKTEDNIVYTLLQDIELSKDIKIVTDIPAIQGSLKVLNVFNSSLNITTTKLHLYNLDTNNRLYFPDVEVAQNGVFINKEYYDIVTNPTAWRRVNNLNDQELGSKVFKFAFDSDKGFPYIEFPSDVANLIEDGFEVYYILSDGLLGYAANNTLTAFNKYIATADTDSYTFEDNSYIITNSASVGAANPETLTETYNNMKKVVGTFDTLVSRRDYKNGIYNIENNNNYYVSNIQVGDANKDINNTLEVVTRSAQGNSYYTRLQKPTSNLSNIYIHATKPFNATINSSIKYDYTYLPINSNQLNDINNELDEYKTIAHRLTLPGTNSSEINFIENRYTLKVNISTLYKVNEYEEKSIINNIKKALFNEFNARNVDFSEEIPYDSLIDVMKNSDDRIKNIILEDPKIDAYVVKGDNSISAYNTEQHNGEDKLCLIKNIIAGRIPFYFEDDNFDYDYNTTSLTKIQNIDFIKTSCTLSLTSTATTLLDNETVQVITDSFIEEVVYPAYVYYSYLGSNTINADTVYRLGANDSLYIYFTDSDGNKIIRLYEEGKFIRPTKFNISNTAAQGAGSNKLPARWIVDGEVVTDKPAAGVDNIPLYALGTEEEISIVKRNEIVLDDQNQQIFWYVKPSLTTSTTLDRTGDLIFTQTSSEYYYILDEGEFFIYPNKDFTSLNILSSGTKLVSNRERFIKDTSKNGVILKDQLYESIEDGDVATFEKYFNWQNLGSGAEIKIIETEINTFVTDNNINSINSNLTINSDWSFIPENSGIQSDNISIISTNINNMCARSIYTLMGDNLQPQQLLNSRDDITIYHNNTLSTTSVSVDSFIQIYPAVDSFNVIDLSVPEYEEDLDGNLVPTDNYLTPYSSILYEKSENPWLTVYYSDGSTQTPADISLNNRKEYNFNSDPSNYITKVSFTNTLSDNLSAHIFNTDTLQYTAITLSATYSVTFTNSTEAYTLYITKPLKLVENPDLDEKITLSDINTTLSSFGDLTFDYLAPLNSSKLISSFDLFSSTCLFDINNVYNMWTIPKIDFDQSEFTLVGSSKK